MNGETFGQVSGTALAAVYAAELLFGLAFCLLTHYAKSKKFLKGRTALFVAGGTGGTIALTAFLSWQFALVMFGAFVFTGLPMIIWDLWWAWREEMADEKRRDDELAHMREELKHGDAS